MIRYSDLRQKSYLDRRGEHQTSLFDIDTWKKNPYSCLKSRVYIELSIIFAYLLQFTAVTPNHVSLIYCLSGIIAGAFLVTDNNSLMIVGLLIFFLKGSIDWTDGLIARIKNQTSSVGHILDTWGSHIGTISLITSIGIYCFNLTSNNIYLFLTILILFLKIIDFKFFAYHQIFIEVLNKKINIKLNIDEETNTFKKKDSFLVLFIKNFMDDRSRSVDPICFMIFLEIVYNVNYFSQIIFGLFFLKSIIIFFGIFYTYYLKEGLKNQI